MILLSHQRQSSLAPTNDRDKATACIRFAVRSQIEISHI
jgi:hypothetical protein